MKKMAGNHNISDNELTHSMVHYLFTIHKLKEEKGYSRVTDIATELGLTKGSVSTAIKNLEKKRLVREDDESKFLHLTDEAHLIVHDILSSRTLLYYFFKDFVGVSEEHALKDACLIEHLLSNETREKFFNFMKNLSCHCGNQQQREFKTQLDLCDYRSSHEFIEKQMGDTHLKL
ncbi:MAG: metal-dependent transcriptional regulator [Bacteriovoracaceae bacterium]